MNDERIEAMLRLESVKIRAALVAIGQQEAADWIGERMEHRIHDHIEAANVFMDLGYSAMAAVLINFGIEIGGLAATQGRKPA